MHNFPAVLSVTGLLFLSSCVDLASAGDSGSKNVTWIAPKDGQSYGPGDTIIGRWTSDSAVVSPSFRICMTDGGGQLSRRRDRAHEHSNDDDDGADDDGDDVDAADDGQHGDSGGDADGDDTAGNCGQAAWPTIGQSDGSYFVHLSLPNVTSVANCYLEMVDDFGDKMASPTFSFGASTNSDSADPAPAPAAAAAAAVATASESSPVGAAAGTETAPASAAAETSPAATKDGPSAPSGTPLAPVSPSIKVNPNPSAEPNSSARPTSSANARPSANPQSAKTNAQTQTQILPSMDESHVPIPTAAYAVPLSLVGSVILAASALSVHQRRKLRHERAREHEALQSRGALLSRHSTLSFGGFVKLGRERAGSRAESLVSLSRGQRTESRSTSVSRMRAWRRDVSTSRHPHRTRASDAESRASETTYAHRTAADEHEHARGAASYTYTKGFTSFPAPLARRLTREPFHAHVPRSGGGAGAGGGAAGARRATMVPAGVWRAAVSPSPVFPSTDTLSLCTESADTPRAASGRWADRLRDREARHREAGGGGVAESDGEWGVLKRKGRTLVDPGPIPALHGGGGGGGAYLNTSITDSVLDRYCHASPVPPSLSPGPPVLPFAISVARPEKLHVRRYAEGSEDEGLGRREMLELKDEERDIYDAVSRSISRASKV